MQSKQMFILFGKAYALAFLLSFLSAPIAAEQRPVIIKIATTPTASERLTHDETRPGYIVELFNRVETIAKVEFEYVYADWDQVLRLVRTNRVDAGFNSSFKDERTAYGAYPMANGKHDPTRSTLEYTYSLYTYGDTKITWDGTSIQGLIVPVGVEKGASILPKLKSLGVQTQEIKTYESMISLLAGGRLQVIAAIDDHLEAAVRISRHRFGDMNKLSPPLETRVGYLMFSKRFCTKSSEMCEAVWNGIRTVKNSDEYKAVRAKYGD